MENKGICLGLTLTLFTTLAITQVLLFLQETGFEGGKGSHLPPNWITALCTNLILPPGMRPGNRHAEQKFLLVSKTSTVHIMACI